MFKIIVFILIFIACITFVKIFSHNRVSGIIGGILEEHQEVIIPQTSQTVTLQEEDLTEMPIAPNTQIVTRKAFKLSLSSFISPDKFVIKDQNIQIPYTIKIKNLRGSLGRGMSLNVGLDGTIPIENGKYVIETTGEPASNTSLSFDIVAIFAKQKRIMLLSFSYHLKLRFLPNYAHFCIALLFLLSAIQFFAKYHVANIPTNANIYNINRTIF